jgi:hypothetical protein
MNGAMGEMPDWYPLIRAARYLGVAPWDLMEQPLYWSEWAITAEAAENEAQEEIRKQHQPS